MRILGYAFFVLALIVSAVGAFFVNSDNIKQNEKYNITKNVIQIRPRSWLSRKGKSFNLDTS